LFFLIQLGERQLPPRDCTGQFGLVIAAIGHELAPFGLALGGEQRSSWTALASSSATASTTGWPPAALIASTTCVKPTSNGSQSGTAQVPCCSATAPSRRSSRHTATRCRDGSAGSR
jgi:hypothetical protein